MCRSSSADDIRRRALQWWWLAAAGLCVHGVALAQAYPAAVSDLVANAKAQVKTIDLESFKAALDRNDAGIVIDVREPAEYAAGHVPSAINIPRGLIELRIWPRVGFPEHTDASTKLTLYCSTGVRNMLAAKSLRDLGLRNVIAVDMRIEDWTKAGYPLVQE